MSKPLEGRMALVTGASRGIGAAVAKAYAAAGAHVILVARTVGALEEVNDSIAAAGGKATIMPCDMGNLDDVDKIGPAIANRFGGLDIIVGNAGIAGTLTPAPHMKADEWQSIFTINLHSNFHLLRTADPLLRASDAGRAIFTGSGLAHKVLAYWGAYSASKAALEQLVKIYAAEVAKTNVRANLVDPGTIDTAMLRMAFPGGFPGRTRRPEEITKVFVDLALPSCADNGKVIMA